MRAVASHADYLEVSRDTLMEKSLFAVDELSGFVMACAYVRPDLCLCGGLSGSKKVAAMAEAQHVKVIPHNPLSPVSTAACVQLDACIPNFALQEYTGESEPPKSDLLVTPLKLDRGYLIVPETPGLGIELNEAALTAHPVRDKVLDTPVPDYEVYYPKLLEYCISTRWGRRPRYERI